MTDKVKRKDITAASHALVDWLQSQELSPEDAVPVLTLTLVATIALLAKREGRDRKTGGEIIAKIIMKSLK